MNTDAFAEIIRIVLEKGGGDERLSRFNSPDFCLDDVMFREGGMMGFLRIVEQLAQLKGKFVEDITFHRIPPGAPDAYIGYFSFALRSSK